MKGLLFLFIIIADDPATRLGCYGDKVAITPNLDRLASEGVVFAKDYCPDAVCTPSRTSFMLGLKMIDDMRLLSHAKSRDPQSDDNLHILQIQPLLRSNQTRDRRPR
jgi:iduronate 2-sulfatase